MHLVVKNEIYLSLTEEIRENCYMTSVIKAQLNFENLNFQVFSTNRMYRYSKAS